MKHSRVRCSVQSTKRITSWRIGLRLTVSSSWESILSGCGTPIKIISLRAWDIAGNGKTVVRGGGTVIYVTPTWWEFLSQQNQNDPVTGLGTNPSGFQICTPTVASGNCAPGPGTIAASGLSLSPAQVNWNQSAALYRGNIYPASSDTTQLKCGTDKLCTAQATNENLRSAYVMQWSLGI
jgi:hypothetical protein